MNLDEERTRHEAVVRPTLNVRITDSPEQRERLLRSDEPALDAWMRQIVRRIEQLERAHPEAVRAAEECIAAWEEATGR